MGDMKNKVALITGVTSGIGRAAALAFAKRGAKVVGTGRRKKLGQQLADEINALGGDAVFLRSDVADAGDVESMVEETLSHFGRLDYAFNNAGIEGEAALLTDQTLESYQQVFDINVRGVWLSMKYQIPAMLRSGGGAIVNNSSVAGLIGIRGFGLYAASKHAVIGLTKTAALEWSEQGIRVNAVCPAAIETEMSHRIRAMRGDPDEQLQHLIKVHPIGRIGEPEEVADAAVWLCSDEASFVTGHAMPVDGALLAQ
ncbi:MAG: SDR family oxidoreductase [Gammaproteobacteria bacterium]|nr:MAG: SDR family oxidoreductase [Gammaproteobacteria bacterium]